MNIFVVLFFLWGFLLGTFKYISAQHITDEVAAESILQLLQLQVAVQSNQSENLQDLPSSEKPPKRHMSNVAIATDLGRAISTDSRTKHSNITRIPRDLSNTLSGLIGTSQSELDTASAASGMVDSVMALVQSTIEPRPGKVQGYVGSEVDLMAMMAIDDLAAVAKAIEGQSRAGQLNHTLIFAKTTLKSNLNEQLTKVFLILLQNWSLDIESLALLITTLTQSSIKADMLDILVDSMVMSKNITSIVKVFKYAFFDADEVMASTFADIAAQSTQGGICQLGVVLGQVTFGVSSRKMQRVINYLEDVDADVCIFSFMSAIDVSRNILETKTARTEASASAEQACVEVPPPGGYTCAQQVQFGKCERWWMIQGGYCLVTCGTCGQNSCVDMQPNTQFTCSQQKQYGKCDSIWMVEGGYCNFTCDRCPASSYPSPAPSPVILLPPIPLPALDVLPPQSNEPSSELVLEECGALYNQTIDIIAVMLNQVVDTIVESLQQQT